MGLRVHRCEEIHLLGISRITVTCPCYSEVLKKSIYACKNQKGLQKTISMKCLIYVLLSIISHQAPLP